VTSALATLAVVLALGACTYGGQRDGFYFAIYSTARNLIAFLCAMTFCEPLAVMLTHLISDKGPAHAYFVVISFAATFGIVFTLLRWLKIKYTYPVVECPMLVDRIGGGAAGLFGGIALSGTVLILWSLMPFMAYIPADLGRIEIHSKTLDTGAIMLKFYDNTAGRMKGNTEFLLEDEELVSDPNKNGRADPGEQYNDLNLNGKWDRGWLWKYKNYANINFQRLEPFLRRGESDFEERKRY